jgi:hypothetical protein
MLQSTSKIIGKPDIFVFSFRIHSPDFGCPVAVVVSSLQMVAKPHCFIQKINVYGFIKWSRIVKSLDSRKSLLLMSD